MLISHFYGYQNWIPELTVLNVDELDKYHFYGGKWSDFFDIDESKHCKGSILIWKGQQVPDPEEGMTDLTPRVPRNVPSASKKRRSSLKDTKKKKRSN